MRNKDTHPYFGTCVSNMFIFRLSLEIFEGHLMDNNVLAEVLNIGISHRVVTSVADAAIWVKRAFLYERIRAIWLS